MNILRCIPKHKHDLRATDRVKETGFPSLNDAIPELLVWVQDANWPVAEPVASVLKNAGPKILPHIRCVLEGQDAVWKYWVIVLVIAESNPEVIEEVRDQLSRLAFNPSREDMRESVDNVAKQVLKEYLSKCGDGS